MKLLKIIGFGLPLLLIALFVIGQASASDTTCNIFAKNRTQIKLYDGQYTTDLSNKDEVRLLKLFLKKINSKTDCTLPK